MKLRLCCAISGASTRVVLPVSVYQQTQLDWYFGYPQYHRVLCVVHLKRHLGLESWANLLCCS